jgi:hypothetical protein
LLNEKHVDTKGDAGNAEQLSHVVGLAIQQRVTAVLRSIPKETFADRFQKHYERCQPML